MVKIKNNAEFYVVLIVAIIAVIALTGMVVNMGLISTDMSGQGHAMIRIMETQSQCPVGYSYSCSCVESASGELRYISGEVEDDDDEEEHWGSS